MKAHRKIVVLASRFDQTSVRLVEQWSGRGARLMTCQDLSRGGWVDHTGASEAEASTAMISGESLKFEEIGGVLVRLPYVSEAELPHIVKADRAYVASEMMAYLVSWLSRLPCPVINRPSPMSLSGPNWRQEEWLLRAAAAGIPVKKMRRSSDGSPETSQPPEPASLLTVAVVGQRSFGTDDALAARHAFTLARMAGVDFLSASFSPGRDGPILVYATLYPRIDAQIEEAILDFFIGGSGRPSKVR